MALNAKPPVWQPEAECMDRDELEQLQLERLQALLARLRRNVRRYRDLLGDLSITSLDDMRNLPLTTPHDLVEAFPYGMFALMKPAAVSTRCMPAPQLNESLPHSGGNAYCPSTFVPSPLAPWQATQYFSNS